MPRRRGLLAAALVAAAFALGQPAVHSGEPTGREIADLIDELRDPDHHVREVAHKGLVALGSAPAEALVAAARGSDSKLSAEALSVLADIGPGAKGVVPKLVEFAASAGSDRFMEITRAVARIDPPAARPLVNRLVELSGSGNANEQADALRMLAGLGGVAKDAADALLARLGTSPPSLRKPLLDTLAALGVDPTNYVLDLWTTSRSSAEAWAPEVLMAIGEPAAKAAAQRLKREDKNARTAAAEALGAMGAAARDAVPDLVFALKDETGAVRRAAAQSLGMIGTDAQVALPALTEGVTDAKLRIQREAVIAIGEIGVAAARPTTFASRGVGRVGAGGGATKQTEGAVMWALRWLKNHQSPDGHWDSAGFDATCKLNRCAGPGEATYNPGVSGLALLAFLGAGLTHQTGTCQETVKNGLQYLRSIQDSDGCFGSRTSQHFMYNHACASMAMTEAYGMTGTRALMEPAQRGVGFILKAKNPYLAWRYNFPPDGDNDTSVTGWMVSALKSASTAGLAVDNSAIADAVTWVEKMTEPEHGRTGYQQRGGPPARTNEMMQRFPADYSESLTAVGVLVRIFAGHTPADDDFIIKGADLMARKLPKWDVDKGTIDFYYWYYATLAMFQVGGDHWKKWNDALTTAVIKTQRMEAERDERASWDPVDAWSPEGGRVYSTAMNCLCMEVYYRYGRVLATDVDRGSNVSPPASGRVMSESLRVAVGALTDALKSDDAEVREAAELALDRLRSAYQSPARPADGKSAPDSPRSAEPPAPARPTENSAAYAAWIDRFADACVSGDARAAEDLWAGAATKSWVFPATVQTIRDGRVWARIASDRTFVFRFVTVVDSLGSRKREHRRWGFSAADHEFVVSDENVMSALRVGTSVDVTIDLDPKGAAQAFGGTFPARLSIWRLASR